MPARGQPDLSRMLASAPDLPIRATTMCRMCRMCRAIEPNAATIGGR
jgi:hypothetical protein